MKPLHTPATDVAEADAHGRVGLVVWLRGMPEPGRRRQLAASAHSAGSHDAILRAEIRSRMDLRNPRTVSSAFLRSAFAFLTHATARPYSRLTRARSFSSTWASVAVKPWSKSRAAAPGRQWLGHSASQSARESWCNPPALRGAATIIATGRRLWLVACITLKRAFSVEMLTRNEIEGPSARERSLLMVCSPSLGWC